MRQPPSVWKLAIYQTSSVQDTSSATLCTIVSYSMEPLLLMYASQFSVRHEHFPVYVLRSLFLEKSLPSRPMSPRHKPHTQYPTPRPHI